MPENVDCGAVCMRSVGGVLMVRTLHEVFQGLFSVAGSFRGISLWSKVTRARVVIMERVGGSVPVTITPFL